MSDTNQKKPDIGAIAGQIASSIPQAQEGHDNAMGDAIRAPFQAMAATSTIIKGVSELLRFVFFTLLEAYIAPLIVCIRLRIGERVMGISTLIYAFILFSIIQRFELLGFQKGTPATLAIILFIGMLIHRILIFYRNRRGEYWHSYYDGIPLLRVPAAERECQKKNYEIDITKVFVEPAIIVAGIDIIKLFFDFDFNRYGRPTEFENLYAIFRYMQSAAIVSALYQCAVFSIQRNTRLDEKDAKVMAEAKQEAEREPPKKGIKNFRGVAILPPRSQEAQPWAR